MSCRSALVLAAVWCLSGASAAAQHVQPRLAPATCEGRGNGCITATFRNADIHDVLAAFADFSGYSIVVGSGVTGMVSAEIRRQPWNVALEVLLRAHGLAAHEPHPGILRVEAAANLAQHEVLAALVTRVFRVNYVPVEEIASTLSGLVSDRGRISTSPTTNTVVVTDTPASVARIAALLGQPAR